MQCSEESEANIAKIWKYCNISKISQYIKKVNIFFDNAIQ